MRAPLFTNADEYNQSIEKRKKIKIKNRKENKSNNNQINNLLHPRISMVILRLSALPSCFPQQL
jgi:hypothetical protein